MPDATLPALRLECSAAADAILNANNTNNNSDNNSDIGEDYDVRHSHSQAPTHCFLSVQRMCLSSVTRG